MDTRRPAIITRPLVLVMLSGMAVAFALSRFEVAEANSVPPSVLVILGLFIGLTVHLMTVTSDSPPVQVAGGHLRVPMRGVAHQVACTDLTFIRVAGTGRARSLILGTSQRTYRIAAEVLKQAEDLERLHAAILREVRALPDGQVRVTQMAKLAAEESYYDSRKPYATGLLLAVISIVFAFQSASSQSNSWPTAVTRGGNASVLVADGQWYRLCTANFLHLNVEHFLTNAGSLLLVGILLERWVGFVRLASIFLLSALGGAVASASMHLAPVSVGSSTGILGLQGTLLAVSIRLHSELGVRPRLRPRALLAYLTIGTFLSSLTPGVDHVAHAGGFAAGFASCWFLVRDGNSTRTPASAFSKLFLMGLTMMFVLSTIPIFRQTSTEERRNFARIASDAFALKARTASSDSEGMLSVGDLSNGAYDLARSPDALPEEVALSLEMAKFALDRAGEGSGYELDTLATSYFRLGYAQHAVDAERYAMRSPTRFFASQFVRFLGGRSAAEARWRGDNDKLWSMPTLIPMREADGLHIQVEWDGSIPPGISLIVLVSDGDRHLRGVVRAVLTEQVEAGSMTLRAKSDETNLPLEAEEQLLDIVFVDSEPHPHEAATYEYFAYNPTVNALP